MSPAVRKGMLAVHLTCSVGWIGAVATYLALGIAAKTSDDPASIRSAWWAMERLGWTVIVPLALASLATGVVMGLGTRWGLLRYYWVTFALVMTAASTVVLVVHMRDVSALADHAREASATELRALGGDLVHAGLALVVLLVILVLNIYKPPGMTRYGWRRRHTSSRSGQAAGTTTSAG
jgi:hypothetical protein